MTPNNKKQPFPKKSSNIISIPQKDPKYNKDTLFLKISLSRDKRFWLGLACASVMSKHSCYFCEKEIPPTGHSHTTASLPFADLQKLASTWGKPVPKGKKNKWVCCDHFLSHPLHFKFGAKNYPGLKEESPKGGQQKVAFVFSF